MILSRDVFNSMSVDRLFGVVYQDLKKYSKYFYCFNVYEEEFNNIIKQIIELTKRTYDCKTDYSDYMKECLFEYIRERLAKQDSNQIQQIVAMFSKNEDISNSEEAIAILELFHALTKNMNEQELNQVLSNLLSVESSPKSSLRQALSYVYNENKEIIAKGEIDSIVSYKLIPFFDYYCMFNSIPIVIPELSHDFIIRQSFDVKTYLDTVSKSPILT